MRICLYTETALPIVGGQEVAIDAVARQLQSLGHDAVVLTLRPRGSQVVDDSHFPYPVIRHRRYFSTRHLLGMYGAALTSVHRRFPFDVLHCHNVYPAGFVAARWLANQQVPLVVTSHACDIAPKSHLLKKPGVAKRVGYVLRTADALIAISDMVEARYHRLGRDDLRVTRIANGADIERLKNRLPRPARLPAAIQPRNYFLHLGRLVERKGADASIEALHAANIPGHPHLVIGGTGEWLERLKAIATRLGLAARVHFLGDVSGDTKCYLLQNAICTVMPSRIAEGAPLVLLESFAAGRPVIGTAIPGLKETIRHGETGWLVPPESPGLLAGALADAVTRAAATDQMGQHALRFAERYDWRSITEQHLALYEELLARQPRRRAA